MKKIIFLSLLLLYPPKIYLTNYAIFIPDNKKTNVYTKSGALNGEKALLFLYKVEEQLKDKKKLTKRISEEFFKKDTEQNTLKNFTDFSWIYEKKDKDVYVYKWNTPRTTISEVFYYYIYQENGKKKFGRTCLFNDLAEKDFDKIYVFEEKDNFEKKAKWNKENKYVRDKIIYIRTTNSDKIKESLIDSIIRRFNEL